MPSARLFFFLFTHAKYVRLSICLRFSVMRLYFYLRLFVFSDAAPAYAKFFSDHLTAFPLFIPGCIPVFSDFKRTLNYFYAFFVRASFTYGRAWSIFGGIS